MEEHKEDNYAIKMAFLYMLANGLSAAMSTTLSSITNSLVKIYSISEFGVFYINSSFVIWFIILNFPANYCIDNFGIKFSINVGALFTLVGVVIRRIPSLFFLYLGQTFMAAGGPFIVNCLSKVSNTWFVAKNRVKMTSIMSSSYMFGLGTGFLITSIMWRDTNDNQEDLKLCNDLLSISSLVTIFAYLPLYRYVREKPAIAPSKTAELPRDNFLEGLFILKNKNFLLLFIAFSIALSNFISLVLMIYSVRSPFGYSESNISNLGVIINFSSGASKIAVAYFVVTFMTIKKTIILNFVCLIISIIFFLLAIFSKEMGLVYISSAILGFFLQMYWGLSFELGCEIVYPVSESHANGYLLFGGCIFGTISNFIVSFFGNSDNPFYFFIYLIISYLFCILCIYSIEDSSKRDKFDMIPLKNIALIKNNL